MRRSLAHTARHVNVDWGTSSFRAWLVQSDNGVVLDSFADNAGGILNPQISANFSDYLDHSIRNRWGAVSRLNICGMITSVNGWIQTGYVPTPASLADIQASTMSTSLEWCEVTFVPGLSCEEENKKVDHAETFSKEKNSSPAEFLHKSSPDVIRGEETQILGAMSLLNEVFPPIPSPSIPAHFTNIDAT